MSSPRETIGSQSGDRLEDHTTIASGEMEEDDEMDDESYSDEEEDDDEDDEDDSRTEAYTDEDSDDSDSSEEQEDDEDVSYVVPAVDKKKSSPVVRTEEQQEQQRRIVDLAASTFSDTEQEYSQATGFANSSTLRSYEGDGDGNTTHTNGTTTDDDRGNGYYTTTQDEANTMTSVGSGSQSMASQSTGTTQPTSPGRPQQKRPVLLRVDGEDLLDNDANESTMTTPEVHNRSSLRKDNLSRMKQFTSPSHQMSSAATAAASLVPPPLSPRHYGSHERVPGGAAAKLMLLGPKGSKESEDSSTLRGSSLEIEPASSAESLKVDPCDVLMAERQRAKEEFCSVKSPSKQHRFQAVPSLPENSATGMGTGTAAAMDDETSSDVHTQVSSTPSFLNRSEIFHETASAAIAALLRPTSSRMSLVHAAAAAASTPNHSATTPSATTKSSSFFPSADTSPRTSTAKSLLHESSTPSSAMATPIVSNHAHHNHHADGSSGGAGAGGVAPVVSSVLISKETERKLEEMQSKMIDPTPTLTDLLTAIASPSENAVTDHLAYAVRRKNACGAVQTLTANSTNRVRICWTAGVLPAITSVLADGLASRDGTQPSKIASYNDARIRTEYESARNRAISALMNLSMPVKNRLAVFHSPNLVHVVLQTIEQDHGLARRGCCAVLAFLAKSSENRLLLAQVPSLMDILRKVLKPRPPRVEPVTAVKEKKVYPWSDEDEVSSSSDSDRNSSKKKGERNSFLSSNLSERSYDDSGDTPKVEGAQSPREISGYDETADDLLQAARQNLFAMVGHLVKEKDNAYHFARDLVLLTTMVEVSRYQESPSHALAVKVLAHLTRHRLNKVLAFKPKIVVPALIEATQSPNDDARLHACYALQNLSQEKSCRQELAIAAHLIEVLCDRCRNGSQTEERLAAISTLKNLADEPANLIPFSNTTGCISTLMYLAHAQVTSSTSNNATTEDGTTATTTSPSAATATPTNGYDILPVTELIQYRACDALATLSHWLRKIATSGHSLDATRQGRPPIKGLFVPSLREVSWNQWT